MLLFLSLQPSAAELQLLEPPLENSPPPPKQSCFSGPWPEGTLLPRCWSVETASPSVGLVQSTELAENWLGNFYKLLRGERIHSVTGKALFPCPSGALPDRHAGANTRWMGNGECAKTHQNHPFSKTRWDSLLKQYITMLHCDVCVSVTKILENERWNLGTFKISGKIAECDSELSPENLEISIKLSGHL